MNANAKKEKAIELLKQMDIYAPYIKGFREKGMVCFFERFGGYWADQEPELYEKMKALEKKYNCIVYAITHEYDDKIEIYYNFTDSKKPDDFEHQAFLIYTGEWEYATNDPAYREMGYKAKLALELYI